MSKTSVRSISLGIVAAVALASFGWTSPAEAHWADCASGGTGNIGSVWCGPACQGVQKWRINVESANVQAQVKAAFNCAGYPAGCGPIIWHCFGDTTTMSSSTHSDSGSCYGEQLTGPYTGLWVNCWPISGGSSDSETPGLTCVGSRCVRVDAQTLASRTVRASELASPVVGFDLFMDGAGAVAFGCTEGYAQCIRIQPTCADVGAGRGCWIGAPPV